MGKHSPFDGLSEKRGKDTDVFDPETLLVAGVDPDAGMSQEVEHLIDHAHVEKHRRILGDPLRVLTSGATEDEQFVSLVVSLAVHGCEKAIEATRVTVGLEEVAAVVDGRDRVLAGRIANHILAGGYLEATEVRDRIALGQSLVRGALDRVLITAASVKADKLSLRDRIHRSNITRKVLTHEQKFTLIRERYEACEKQGVSPRAEVVADALGIGLSEVRAAFVVLRGGSQELVSRVEDGDISPTAAAIIAPMRGPEQAQTIAAMDAGDDHTVAAARVAKDAVRSGKTVTEAAATVRQVRGRKCLSIKEVADLLESAKAVATSPEVVSILRLVVEGPDALTRKERTALGLRVAIDALESRRAK